MDNSSEINKKKKLLDDVISKLSDEQVDELLEMLSKEKELLIQHLLDYLKR